MKVRLAYPIQSDSIVDGEGLRSVIWFQGCKHYCKGCHNPETWNMNQGYEVDIEQLKKEIEELELQDGVTFSGGDPMFQPEALLYLLKVVKENGMNTWVYSGYTFDKLLEIAIEKSIYRDILNNIDVLVDGLFELENKSLNVIFRGSTNQRIIDVKKSIKEGQVCLVDKYKA